MFIVLTEEEFEALKNPGPSKEDSAARLELRQYLSRFMQAVIDYPYYPVEHGDASQWARRIRDIIGEPPAL